MQALKNELRTCSKETNFNDIPQKTHTSRTYYNVSDDILTYENVLFVLCIYV